MRHNETAKKEHTKELVRIKQIFTSKKIECTFFGKNCKAHKL